MRLGRVLVVSAVALVLVVAGYAAYAVLIAPGAHGGNTLVVYSYTSLLGGCGGSVAQSLLANFTAEYGVPVDLECPPGTLVNTLLSEKNAPAADVVVGLDEITAPQAEADGLLVPYTPPSLRDVNGTLAAELSPDHAVTPYEWGYLAFDYNVTFLASTQGAIRNATFEQFAANTSWSSNLMIEDPTADITGEEFLLWEIAYATYVAHVDWRSWWQAVLPHLRVAPDWSSAFADFSTPPNNPGVVVSYSLDPAYAAYYGGTPSFNATVAWHNGSAYGWKTIYGVGIVAGTRHLTSAQEFVNWFLSGGVQAQLPTNEWEYPANGTVELPGVFAAALDPREIVALNPDLSPSMIVQDLPGWIGDWQTIANQ